MKTLRCRDVGFDCDHEIRAESEDEVLRDAAAHAQTMLSFWLGWVGKGR